MLLHLSSATYQIKQLEDVLSVQKKPLIPSENEVVNVLTQWFSSCQLQIFTSGSTGKPAQIRLEENILRWSTNNTQEALNLSRESALLCLPANRIGGAMMVVRSAIYDWELTVVKPTANPMENLPEDHTLSFVSLVPNQVAAILSDPISSEKFGRFSNVLIGGSSISTELENQICLFESEVKTTFFHTYGMTETASHIGLRRIHAESKNPYFTLFDDVEAGENPEGCLQVKIPKLNFQVLTNDRVELLPEGLNYLGRKDDVVNSGGIKIQLESLTAEVESFLKPTSIKSTSYFFWKEADPKWGEALIAVCLTEVNTEDFLATLKAHLAPTHLPKKCYSVQEFIRTPTGKIDRFKTLGTLSEIGG